MADGSQSLDSQDFTQSLAQAAGAPGSAGARDNVLGQSDIEELLKSAGVVTGAQPTAAARGKAQLGDDQPRIASGDVEYLLNQAEQALASINAPIEHPDVPRVQPFRLQDFAGAPASSEAATLDLIRDVELDLKIELGRTNMYLEDVLKLRKGSVVPLDKLAGDPVDVYVNGRLIARGEVLVLNDNFCVRVAELISSDAPA
jgi:flagellar motor switch protein FliN/FliY